MIYPPSSQWDMDKGWLPLNMSLSIIVACRVPGRQRKTKWKVPVKHRNKCTLHFFQAGSQTHLGRPSFFRMPAASLGASFFLLWLLSQTIYWTNNALELNETRPPLCWGRERQTWNNLMLWKMSVAFLKDYSSVATCLANRTYHCWSCIKYDESRVYCVLRKQAAGQMYIFGVWEFWVIVMLILPTYSRQQ